MPPHLKLIETPREELEDCMSLRRIVTASLSLSMNKMAKTGEYFDVCRELVGFALEKLEEDPDAEELFEFDELEIRRLRERTILPERRLTADVLSKVRMYAEECLRRRYDL